MKAALEVVSVDVDEAVVEVAEVALEAVAHHSLVETLDHLAALEVVHQEEADTAVVVPSEVGWEEEVTVAHHLQEAVAATTEEDQEALHGGDLNRLSYSFFFLASLLNQNNKPNLNFLSLRSAMDFSSLLPSFPFFHSLYNKDTTGCPSFKGEDRLRSIHHIPALLVLNNHLKSQNDNA